jgi:hypothetical protein
LAGSSLRTFVTIDTDFFSGIISTDLWKRSPTAVSDEGHISGNNTQSTAIPDKHQIE